MTTPLGGFTEADVIFYNKKAAANPYERRRWVEWANSYLTFQGSDRGKAIAYANSQIAKERRRNGDVDERLLERAAVASGPWTAEMSRWRAALNRKGMAPPGEVFYADLFRRAADYLRQAAMHLGAAVDSLRELAWDEAPTVVRACREFMASATAAAVTLDHAVVPNRSMPDRGPIHHATRLQWDGCMSDASRRVHDATSILREVAFDIEKVEGRNTPNALPVWAAVVWLTGLSDAISHRAHPYGGHGGSAWSVDKPLTWPDVEQSTAMNPPKVAFVDEWRGEYGSGSRFQSYHRLYAYDPTSEDVTVFGHVDYSTYDDGRKIRIEIVETRPEFRRQGVATLLAQELRRRHPKAAIAKGYLTDDGAAFERGVRRKELLAKRSRPWRNPLVGS